MVLRLTFLDASGVQNGVLLTVFLSVLMMALITLVGLATRAWPPAYVWLGWFGIAVWGIGADGLLNWMSPAAFTQQAYGGLASAGGYRAAGAGGADYGPVDSGAGAAPLTSPLPCQPAPDASS